VLTDFIGSAEIGLCVILLMIFAPESILSALRALEELAGSKEGGLSRRFEPYVSELKALRRCLLPGVAVMAVPPLSVLLPQASSWVSSRMVSLLAPGVDVFTVSWYDPVYASMSFAFAFSLPAGAAVAGAGLLRWLWPALRPEERRVALRALAWVSACALLALPYSVMECRMLTGTLLPAYMPRGVRQGMALVELARAFEAVYVGTALLLCAPVGLWAARRLGVIGGEAVSRIKPLYAVATWAVAMAVTPDPTPVTTVMIWVPCAVPVLLMK